MTRTTHKRGDTFELSGPITVTDNGQPVASLVGWTGRSQIRTAATGELVAELTFEWLDAAARLVRLRCADTSTWPLGLAEVDIELTSPAGSIVSTDTAQIHIVKDVTRP